MNSVSLPPAGIPTPAITDYLQPPAVGLTPTATQGRPFREILQEKMVPNGVDVQFSAHARQRMEARGIMLDDQTLTGLDQAIDLAREKGGHLSLILMDRSAFVVNVDNRTVITALDQAQLQSNVITQIDSTVVLPTGR